MILVREITKKGNFIQLPKDLTHTESSNNSPQKKKHTVLQRHGKLIMI